MFDLKYISKKISIKDPVIIVGNSPSALNSHKGNEIDKFNTVIRFNNFNTYEQTKFIGGKTDIVFVSNTYANLYSKKEINFEVIVVDNSMALSFENLPDNHCHSDLYASLILKYKYGPFKNFLRTSDHKGTWLNLIYPKNITLGLFATLLLVESKIKPTLHGIDFNYNKKSKSYKDFNETHFYPYEKKILKNLKKNNLINFL